MADIIITHTYPNVTTSIEDPDALVIDVPSTEGLAGLSISVIAPTNIDVSIPTVLAGSGDSEVVGIVYTAEGLGEESIPTYPYRVVVDISTITDVMQLALLTTWLDSIAVSEVTFLETNKSLVNTSALSEQLLIAIATTIGGTLTASETFTAVANKGFTETLSPGEVFSITFAVAREYTDTATTSETLSHGFQLASIIETLTVTEVHDEQSGKGAVDSSVVSEAFAADFGREYSETYTVTEALVKAIALASISESLTTSEVFLTESGISGEYVETMALSEFFSNGTQKTQADTATMSSVYEITPGKVLGETLTTSSSGSLLNQDYSDSSAYFLSDYVGDSRTF